MSAHVESFSTPISKALSDENGEYGLHHGTGTYFEADRVKYLITNEHVAFELTKMPLTHMFKGSETIFRLINPMPALPVPADVAICRIDEKVWGRESHDGLAIPLSRFARRHAPVQHELLFFAGFSGERSKFCYDTLATCGTPYGTQECPFSDEAVARGGDPNFHFSLFYSPDRAQSIDGKSSLPIPPGFSGSLVWDTKLVACLQSGKEWSPDMAEITGIVWGWPSSAACILATKVEFMGVQDLLDRERRQAISGVTDISK
ncbi:hypothetical protein ET418_04715 [Oryzomonas rubra]|uniref:Trypsin-like peptidase domain-containing protein n=2 Tax=Oryzomonas rubra TaxID=2509454 RepID=A0A5A9XMP2_9BACT|nr:hypothetical protein ET418_04715 [Oryzomonas rubra]